MKWFRRKRKKESVPSDEDSYRDRVSAFWEWWSSEAQRIYQSVDDDGGASIQPEISERVNRLYQNIGWVFGPGENGEGHSFTLTPEGSSTKRILVEYWFSKAPSIPGWTFYTSRQGSGRMEDFSIHIADTDVSTESLWITPTVDIEEQKVSIKAWSPSFAEMDEDTAGMTLFILLDEILGEEVTSCCLGDIEIEDGELSASLPLLELKEFIDETFAKNEWSKEAGWGSVYKQEVSNEDVPRGDIFVGSTEDMNLIHGYNRDFSPFEDSSKAAGAEFVFVQLPAAILPETDAVHFRGEIEDALDEEFKRLDSGKVIGGAMGTAACYVDLVLFDAKQGRESIESVMGDRGYSDQFQVLPFTK